MAYIARVVNGKLTKHKLNLKRSKSAKKAARKRGHKKLSTTTRTKISKALKKSNRSGGNAKIARKLSKARRK